MRLNYGLAGLAALGLAGLWAAPSATAQQLPQAAGGQQAVQSTAQPAGSVYDVLMNDPRFGTTMKMVYVAGRANQLAEAGPLTVFAATNAGWDQGDYGGYLASLSSTGAVSAFPEPTEITEVLRGFFVRGEPTLGQTPDVTMRSAAGRSIEFDKNTMTVKWVDENGVTRSAKVAGSPIQATNGVVYPVDAVVGS